jgi:uncharacterized protein (DUF934 family)
VEDHWSHVPDLGQQASSATLPDGDIIVSLTCWQARRELLRARGSRVGVRLQESDDVGAIADDLRDIDLIALTFGTFSDGRGFSQARLLRQRHGYSGEIRATGRFLRDQLFFMERCGFDAFEVNDEPDPQAVMRAFSEISVRYQPSVDGPGLSDRLLR